MNSFLRKVHKWLGLLMAAQILAWMISGFYFSIFPISEIRGEHLTRPATPLSNHSLGEFEGFAAVSSALDEHFSDPWEMSALSVVEYRSGAVWKAEGTVGGQPFRRLLEPVSSEVIPRLGNEEAAQRAAAWLTEKSRPAGVEWIAPGSGDTEFRGRNEAAWKVSFTKPESLRIYLHPWTGEILARRTSRWRLFDFLWMLHIMDYETRDDFNHPLLQFAALAGVMVALSGLVYWFLSSRAIRKRRVGARH